MASQNQKRSHRPLSHHSKQMLELMDEYAAIHKCTEVDPIDAARWAIKEEKWEEPREDMVKKLANLMRRAAREDFFTDDNGEPVRRRHPYPYKVADEPTQKYLWLKMEEMSPGQFRVSTQVRRRGMVYGAIQNVRDVSYFNFHFNPGEPIEVSVDFTEDVAEHRQSGEYVDEPPMEDDGPKDDK
jgi:hypothetical protein